MVVLKVRRRRPGDSSCDLQYVTLGQWFALVGGNAMTCGPPLSRVGSETNTPWGKGIWVFIHNTAVGVSVRRRAPRARAGRGVKSSLRGGPQLHQQMQ